MKHFFRTFSKWDYLFFVLCGIGYYLLIRQYIPYCCDDLGYCFVSGEDCNYVDSLRDVLASNAYDYLHQNGRFLVHCFVSFFCGYGGHILYFIGSTCMFVLLLMSLVYLVGRNGKHVADKYWTILAFILLVPLPGIGIIGEIAFVVNYLWSAAIYTFFLCIYTHIKEDNVQYNAWQNLLVVLFGLVCGSWQESFSIGIAGALFFYHIVHIKQTRSTLLYLVLAFGIGACVGIFSPANFARSADAGLEIYRVGYLLTQIIKHVPAVSVVVLLAVLSGIIDWKRKRRWQFIRENSIYFMASLFALLFALIIAFKGGYQLTVVSICAIVLSIRFLYRYIPMHRKAEWAVAAVAVITGIAIYIPAYIYRGKIQHSLEKVTANFNAQPYCIAGELEQVDREMMKGSYFRNYINGYAVHDFYSNPIIAEMYSRYLNKCNKVDCGLILPESKETIVATCAAKNLVDSCLYASERYSYYIVRLPLEEDYKLYVVDYQGRAVTIVDKVKDCILRRTARPYTVGLAGTRHAPRPRYFEDNGYRYFIMEAEAGKREVVNMRLRKL